MSDVEFSRIVAVDQINRPKELHLTAESAELQALADRFGLLSLDRLEAWVTVKPQAKGRVIRLSGRFEAEVVQTCVVTLDPLPSTVAEDFSMVFTAEQEDNAPGREILLEVEDDDPPEPIVDGAIDLGEVVAEHVALTIDPFPRKPGAAFTPQTSVDGAGDGARGGNGDTAQERGGKPNPFAVLATLRKPGDK